MEAGDEHFGQHVTTYSQSACMVVIIMPRYLRDADSADDVPCWNGYMYFYEVFTLLHLTFFRACIMSRMMNSDFSRYSHPAQHEIFTTGTIVDLICLGARCPRWTGSGLSN